MSELQNNNKQGLDNEIVFNTSSDDDKLKELLKLCPHMSMIPKEMQLQMLQTTSPEVLKSHLRSINVNNNASKCPINHEEVEELKCPFQTNTDEFTEMNPADFKCMKCGAYLINAKINKNKDYYCQFCCENLNDFEDDTFKQYLVNSYVDILFERNDPNILQYSEEEKKLKKIEHYLNLSTQEYQLNKKCGIYWMEKANFMTIRELFSNKINILSKFLIIHLVISGKLSDMLLSVDSSVKSIEKALEYLSSSITKVKQHVNEDLEGSKDLIQPLMVSIIKMGDIYLYRLKDMKAKEMYEEVITTNNNVIDSNMIVSYVKLGDVALVLENNQYKAKENYEKAISLLNPENDPKGTLFQYVQAKCNKLTNLCM
ncbi:hypothetical protein ABK040_005791 [Willaertia magna]